jgi:hypothetical protein
MNVHSEGVRRNAVVKFCTIGDVVYRYFVSALDVAALAHAKNATYLGKLRFFKARSPVVKHLERIKYLQSRFGVSLCHAF